MLYPPLPAAYHADPVQVRPILRVNGGGFVLVPQAAPSPGLAASPSGMPGLVIDQDGMGGMPRAGVPSVDMPADSVPGDAVPQAAPPPRKPARPAWILVLPVERRADGGVSWGRESAWSRQWVAPQRHGTMRMVAIMGDADDRVQMPPQLLADPDNPATMRAALALARKFGAPAVALVMCDPNGAVSVSLWRSGGDPGAVDGQATPETAHATALDLLVHLADPDSHDDTPAQAAVAQASLPSTPAARPAATPAANSLSTTAQSDPVPGDPLEVDLEQHPEFSRDGGMGFAVVMASSDPHETTVLQHVMSTLPGARVLSMAGDLDGAVVTGSYAGTRTDMVAGLHAANVEVTGP